MRLLTCSPALSTVLALALLTLSACTPATRTPATRTPATSSTQSSTTLTAPTFRAAFSTDGVAWVSGGRACVARSPSFDPICPPLGHVADVAWNGGDAWAALPDIGQVMTIDRAVRSIPAGAAVALSQQAIYREDGTALDYSGANRAGVAGAPTQAITGGDRQDYVVLAGQLRRVTDNALTEAAPLPYLAVTPTGIRTASAPTAYGLDDSYSVANGLLVRRDVAGHVLGQVAHAPALVGLVGEKVVTVTATGERRVFTLDLREINFRGGTAR